MQSMAPADGETVEVADGVHLTQLVVGERTSIQHFHVEPGVAVPRHSHEHEQAGFVVSGTFTALVDGDEHVIHAGESYVIPSGTPHAVENRADVPVGGINVFSPPRIEMSWK